MHACNFHVVQDSFSNFGTLPPSSNLRYLYCPQTFFFFRRRHASWLFHIPRARLIFRQAYDLDELKTKQRVCEQTILTVETIILTTAKRKYISLPFASTKLG